MSAQVKNPESQWGIKYNGQNLGLGLVTPEMRVTHVIAPGAGAGGVGIESGAPAAHFVTFAGLLTGSPSQTMNRLQCTLRLDHPVLVRLYSLEGR